MPQQISSELANIQEWIKVNKLSLNVSKTKSMIFHYHQRNTEHIVSEIEINNFGIEKVSEFHFLGLTIDEHISSSNLTSE